MQAPPFFVLVNDVVIQVETGQRFYLNSMRLIALAFLHLMDILCPDNKQHYKALKEVFEPNETPSLQSSIYLPRRRTP